MRAIASHRSTSRLPPRCEHFDTYNRTAASQRVADIVSALRATPGAILVASGDEALAGALASAIEPPRLAVLDVKQFDASSDQAFLDHVEIPGIRRAGDFGTAADMVGKRLVMHNAGSALRGREERLTPTEIVRLVRDAAR